MKSENKNSTYIVLSIRIILEIYKIFRTFYFLNAAEGSSSNEFFEKFIYGFYTIAASSKINYSEY